MAEIRWQRYPRVAVYHVARKWLGIEADLGLPANTIDAYGRSLEDYLTFSATNTVDISNAKREHIAAYVHHLASRRNPKPSNVVVIDSGVGWANATLQQRLTAIRLFYDYLIEEGHRVSNRVGRGRYTPTRCFGGARERGLISRFKKLPWIPNDDQWRAVIEAARHEPLRNRVMLALSYDAALRREELCSLQTGDIDPSRRMISIRAENTKHRRPESYLIRKQHPNSMGIPAGTTRTQYRTWPAVPFRVPPQSCSAHYDLDLVEGCCRYLRTFWRTGVYDAYIETSVSD